MELQRLSGNPLLPPLSFADQVYTAVREAIVRLEFRPGEPLSENELAERFGISRSPIRRALALLQKEGLIVTFPQRGTYVTLIEPEEVEDCCELRHLFESWAFDKMLAANLDLNWDELAENLKLQQLAVERESYTEFLDLDSQFHLQMILAAGNKKMGVMYEQANLVLSRIRAWELRVKKTLHDGLREHQEIFSAIEERDFVKAKELCLSAIEQLLPSMKRMQREHPEYFS